MYYPASARCITGPGQTSVFLIFNCRFVLELSSNRGPQETPRDGMDGMERSSFSGFQRQFVENPTIFRAEMEKYLHQIECGNQKHHPLTGSALEVISVRLLGSVLAPSLTSIQLGVKLLTPSWLRKNPSRATEMKTSSQSASRLRWAGPRVKSRQTWGFSSIPASWRVL
jgi:hypothetical protein